MSEIESIKYSSYTPAQKKASQQYRLKNKDKINAQRKRYYQKRKETDPNFLEYKRTKAREYYEKKKLDKVVIPLVSPDVKTEVEVLVVKVDPIITDAILTCPVVDSVIKVPDEVIKKKKVKKSVTVVVPTKV